MANETGAKGQERWDNRKPEWWNRLHVIWTDQVGNSGYAKTPWQELEKAITDALAAAYAQGAVQQREADADAAEMASCGTEGCACMSGITKVQWDVITKAIRANPLPQRAQDFVGAAQHVRDALKNILDKMDAMEKPLNGLCTLGHIHGMPYTGPNWKAEYDAGRAVLADEAAASREGSGT